MNPQWLNWIIESPLIVRVLLKMTAFLMLAWVAHFALRRANPRWRVLLWRGVAVGLTLIPILVAALPSWKVAVRPTQATPTASVLPESNMVEPPSPVPSFAPHTREPTIHREPEEPTAVTPAPATAARQSSFSFPAWVKGHWAWIATGVWIAITSVLVARFSIGWRRIRRIVKATTSAPGALRTACDEIARALGIARPVEILLSDGVSSPFLTGLRRPLLILPRRMGGPDYSQEMGGILGHELSHLRSNDLFWGYVLQWLSLALWFHPLVWRMRAAHASACEEVSDAVTAHLLGDAKSYSQTLARVALEMSCRPPAVGGIPMARVSDICRRLKALKRRVFSKPLSRTSVVGCLVAGLLAIALLSGLRLGHTKSGETETKVGEDEPEITAPAWEALRGLNTGPLLQGMPQRLAKEIRPARRTSDLWVAKREGTDVRMNIGIEGTVRGEIVVGFFGDVNWSDLRAVRAFKVPGLHSVKGLPPGRYYVGAMIGDPLAPDVAEAHRIGPRHDVIREAGTVRIETISRPPELLHALGVHKSWPQAVAIKKGQATRIELLLSPDFRSSAVPLDISHLRSSLGFWPDMDESNMLKGRVTDSTGQPAPFADIQIRQYKPGAPAIMAPDVVADGKGFFCYDEMEWPYYVGAIFHENLTDRIGTRGHYKWIPKVFEGKQEINIQLEPFPTGTATLRGKAIDHKGRPLTRFGLRVEKHGPPASLPDTEPWSSSIAYFNIPYVCEDGRFELTGLPGGTCKVNATIMESGAFEHDWGTTVELTEGEATDVQIMKRARRPFYGRAVFEDGRPVYPGSAWLDEPAEGGPGPYRRGGCGIRATGLFVLYVSDEQMDPDDLKSKMAVIRWTGPDQILCEVGRFPLSQLSEDRDITPTLKCKRPERASEESAGVGNPEPETGGVSAPSEDPGPKAKESGETHGRIRGVVLNAETGKPVAGAQVAVGHHLGKRDVDRIRERGVEGALYVTAETDEEGRFVLKGVGFWDYHLFSVKRPGFVPHEEWVALRKDDPETEVNVPLKVAGALTVKVVDAEGMPMLGQVVRIESKDGHALLPARGDWRPELPYRTGTAKMGTCSFEALPPGVYSVEAMREGVLETIHSGATSTVSVEAGETKEVVLKQVNHHSDVKVEIEKDPHVVSRWVALVVINRNPGLLAWAGRNFYHPEDDRLARVMQYTLNANTADSFNELRSGSMLFSESPYTFRNFPPGTYAILAITWGKYKFEDTQYEAVCIRGAGVKIAYRKEQVVKLPWAEPEGPYVLNPRILNNKVKLEARQYGAQELCDFILEAAASERVTPWGSEARIVAAPSIREEKVAFATVEMSLWDLIERTYLLKGWRLAGDFKAKTIVLRPEAPSRTDRDEARTRGQIRGVAVNADTGEPIAGAYVAVDRSGDAGGSNLGRFREQGIYVTTETHETGRFLLDGVAFRDDHPFMVTHPGFVRHQETIAVKKDEPEIDIRVRLRPAATLVAKIVDADGRLLQEHANLRLEAEDGRPFFPLRGDWPDLPYRMESTNTGTFSFGELDTGTFSIEAMRVGNMETTYHAKVSNIAVDAGVTKEVLLKPADHRSTVKIKIEKDPHASIGETKGAAAVLLTSEPGLLAWAGRNFYHPEDERLGRVWKNAIIMAMLIPIEDADTLRKLEAKARLESASREGNVSFFLSSGDMTYTLRDFPQGEYAVFTYAMGMYKDWKSPAVYLRGAKAVVSPGREQTVEILYVEPIGPSSPNIRVFYNQVTLEARDYTAREICELLGKQMSLKPEEIVADSSIRDQKVALPSAKLSIWDLLETIYLKKGWKLEADYKAKRLVLRPSASSNR